MFKLERGIFMSMDTCISCGNELAIMERNRSECWDCRDKVTETYEEEIINDHLVF